jgi:subtilisin-like proprotein convertase family protein
MGQRATTRMLTPLAVAVALAAGHRAALADVVEAPIWTSAGVQRRVLDVDEPMAATSRARAAAKEYVVRARVVVRAASREALQAGLDRVAAGGGAGGEAGVAPAGLHSTRAVAMNGGGVNAAGRAMMAQAADIPGFFVVDVASVTEAARVAGLLAGEAGVTEAYVDIQRPRADRDLPTDPGVPSQWYINNVAAPAADVNVEPAWDAGFVGSGVVVGILEGGFQATHQDLAANFNSGLSQPSMGFSAHGTAVAGLVGMVANNGVGGAGVAYGATLSRLYYGTDSDTAASLGESAHSIAVKNNSWGPFDNATLGPISSVEQAAIQSAVATGRGGLGTVFVWAAGNGGQSQDRVDYDQYAGSRYVMAIGAIDNTDNIAPYSEPGASLLLVTTSSSNQAGSGMYTAAPSSPFYTSNFGGTSSSAPIASGVVALMLQARPGLSWRDVAHVLIRSARRVRPSDSSWTSLDGSATPPTGSMGNVRVHSEAFGFGAIDAAAAVSLAQTWPLVGPERSWTSGVRAVGVTVPDGSLAGVTSVISVPTTLRVERAQVTLNAPHPRLGDLAIELVSPRGVISTLARDRSDFSAGYTNWRFTSVRAWDQLARGNWSIRLSDRRTGETGQFANWTLELFGSTPACPADWDDNGSLTSADVFAFLASWFESQADFNTDGATSVRDIFDFLSAWFAGC